MDQASTTYFTSAFNEHYVVQISFSNVNVSLLFAYKEP